MSDIDIPVRVQIGDGELVEIGTIGEPAGIVELFHEAALEIAKLQLEPTCQLKRARARE